jgi:hypothetical protein
MNSVMKKRLSLLLAALFVASTMRVARKLYLEAVSQLFEDVPSTRLTGYWVGRESEISSDLGDEAQSAFCEAYGVVEEFADKAEEVPEPAHSRPGTKPRR